MRLHWPAALTASILIASSVQLTAADPPDPGVTLIGTAFISGTASDLSGLSGTICALGLDPEDVTANCIAKTILGGFGSGLAYTGHDNVFVAVPDRGPFDGRTDVPYLDRFHFMHITIDTSVTFPPAARQSNIHVTLLDTRLFKGPGNTNFVGDAYAFSTTDPLATLRFDPEGVRVGPAGTFFVSDEYGPYVREFNRQGQLIARLGVPSKFLLADPPAGNQSGDINNVTDAASLELTPANNSTGRQANRGMEGLAITPDGTRLVGIMQSALIQDNGLNVVGDPNTVPGRRGLNNRILTIDVTTGETHEYVYVMDGIPPTPPAVGPPLPGQGRGVNEMLAINDHEFLVLERDNRTRLATPATTPNLKRIYKIDLLKNGLNDVTDVSNVVKLPQTGDELAGVNIVPVKKTLFIDLLKDVYKPYGTETIKSTVAEKIEGLAWGPDLPDGKHLLYVISDNDLNTGLETQIYAFAIGTEAGINYVPQQLPEPLFPPGQVKNALK
jgi:hypothetical protein